MKLFGGAYQGRKVLITGHTGFKGSWLSLWLEQLGAAVSGIALPPDATPNHWDLLRLGVENYSIDIRDVEALRRVVRKSSPEIIFHLAAQPLVRRSYRDPLLTWQTNVLGTANLLDACREIESIKAIVIVTSDKCYENREWHWGYREVDSIGGRDPYSASKGATELLVASYRESFFVPQGSALVATARAGNVIGGGDWSEDRLIPDAVRAITNRRTLDVRSPNATRPWQHVLESLAGYLLLGKRLLDGERSFAKAWNFGPDQSGNCTVAAVLARMRRHWPVLEWRVTSTDQHDEAALLYLDSSNARRQLGWSPIWGLDETIENTVIWYRSYLEGGEILSRWQLETFSARLLEADSACNL